MVEIGTPQGVHEIPLFKLAEGLTRSLALDEPMGNQAQGVANMVTQFTYGDKKFANAKVLPTGGLNPHVMCAIPLMLQDAYDHLSIPDDKPQVKFMMVALFYRSDRTANLVLMDNQSAENDGFKAELTQMLNSGEYVGFTPFVAALSNQQKVEFPAQRMIQSLQRAHKTMFDRNRYDYGIHRTVFERHEGYALQHDQSEAADRLLPAIVDVYGGTLHAAEQKKGGVTSIVPQKAFIAMEEGEMPDRYRGRATGH